MFRVSRERTLIIGDCRATGVRASDLRSGPKREALAASQGSGQRSPYLGSVHPGQASDFEITGERGR